MSLHYLSGDIDTINGKKKKAKGSSGGGGKGKGGKQPKTKKKKVAKIALAPVRAAFLTVTSLNLLRTGTKLARVWQAPGGKDRLIKWWTGQFKGDANKLKQAIAKGSKQTINGAEMGIAVEATIAAATAALIAVSPIIKEFKAGGDKKETAEFDKGITDGKETLANDPDIEKGTAGVPEGEEVGVIKGGAKGKGANDGAVEGSMVSPIGISFKLLLMLPLWNFTNPILQVILSIVYLYALIGFFIMVPLTMFGRGKALRIANDYFRIPASWFFSLTNIFSNGYKKIFG